MRFPGLPVRLALLSGLLLGSVFAAGLFAQGLPPFARNRAEFKKFLRAELEKLPVRRTSGAGLTVRYHVLPADLRRVGRRAMNRAFARLNLPPTSRQEFLEMLSLTLPRDAAGFLKATTELRAKRRFRLGTEVMMPGKYRMAPDMDRASRFRFLRFFRGEKPGPVIKLKRIRARKAARDFRIRIMGTGRANRVLIRIEYRGRTYQSGVVRVL